MSSPTQAGPRVYRGLARRERAGWILGLTPTQALCCLGFAAPVLLSFSAGHWPRALALAGIDGLGALLVVVPVRGRPALRWMAHLGAHRLGATLGWSI